MRDLTISHAVLLRRPGSCARAEPGGELNGNYAGVLLQRPGLARGDSSLRPLGESLDGPRDESLGKQLRAAQ